MSRFLSFCIGLFAIAAAYLYAFGTPDLGFVGIQNTSEESAASSAQSSSSGRPARGGGRRGGGATVVTIGAVQKASYSDVLRAIGTGEAINSVEVVSDVAGQVEETNLAANTVVKTRDMLVRLESRTETINLEIAKATLKQAQDQVARYEQLGTGNSSVVSAVTVADARTALAQAQLQVELAENALEDRIIRSPIDGVLGLSRVKVGANLTSSTSIVTVDDIEELLVEFELPERAFGILSQQKEVLLSTPVFAGKVFKGEIFAYDNRIDSTTRTITVQARIDNGERLLLPGMSFAVRVVNESEPGAVVPTNAISWTRNGSQVWVVEDNIAKPVPAAIVMRQQDRIWVDADLADGTQIVIEGTQKLREGIEVRTANTATRQRTGENRAPAGSADEAPAGQKRGEDAGAAQ